MMEFKNLDILTNKSHLQDYYAMHYNNFNDDMQDFIHKVTVEGHFKNSKLSSDDLAYFAPETVPGIRILPYREQHMERLIILRPITWL